ncbi:MAG TPA: (d)CMP kinase [Streptosporangiaceae bacterium]|jgi:cytidylate kinase|nr:(d)CMP kinase [Streptosporangiaceae bacterium]
MVTDCLVIAVDGPSGSGKSSAARGVARALGSRYLDTGAMYRALTWWMLGHGVDLTRPEAIATAAGQADLTVSTDPDHSLVQVDGTDVSSAIRTRQVSNSVSAVAAVPEVRARLIAMQQAIIAQACAAGDGIVAEGRDIGTVVAPNAPVKVFLTASEPIRARRRSADLAADPAATVTVTQAEQERRDRADAPQTVMASDAVEIDSSGLALDEVVGAILALVRQRTSAAWSR